MRKEWLVSLAVTAVFLMGLTTMEVNAEDEANEEVNEVELTIEQKDELSRLHQNVLEQHVQIINKYVEYGVFTEEKGKKIIGHMEKHYKKLEENNFIPKWDKHKRHGKNQHP